MFRAAVPRTQSAPAKYGPIVRGMRKKAERLTHPLWGAAGWLPKVYLLYVEYSTLLYSTVLTLRVCTVWLLT